MEVPAGCRESDIAVVGMACHFPDAPNYAEFWGNLKAGRESVTVFTEDELKRSGEAEARLNRPNYIRSGVKLQDVEMFDAAFFGMSPREAAIMDPQHRHFLECAWEAIEDAGYTPEGFRGPIGVFGGCGMNAYFMFNILTNPGLVNSAGLFLLRHTGNDKDFLTTRVSYCLNLTGPSVSVQTACSTALVAIHLAGQSLLNGECDMALAGGVTIELPHGRGYLYEDGEILSNDGHCRAFDRRAKGTIFGSGAGVVVLRRLADAIRDNDTIHAIVKSTAINNDGSTKVGYFAPSVDGQAQAVAEAIEIAELDPETITYIEMHGTGTPIGDPIEVAALTHAFRRFTKKTGFCRIGSVKTNIGHLDTAAGIAGFIKVVLALKHGQIPASLHYEAPNPIIDFAHSPFVVNARLCDWVVSGHPRRGAVSALGVGGTNSHAILEEASVATTPDASEVAQLLVWSAKSASSLARVSERFAAFFSGETGISLADAAYTLQTGRRHFPYRQFAVCSSVAEAAGAVSSSDPKVLVKNFHEGREPSVVFMFPGQGAQYPGMGRGLYAKDHFFRGIVDECAERFTPLLGVDLRELVFADDKDASAHERLKQTAIAQPAIFTVAYALAQRLVRMGVKPAAMIGHSLGEYVAACISGVFSLQDAIHVIAARGRLMQRQMPGSMLAVRAGQQEVRPHLPEDLEIAVVNAPDLLVLSGPRESVEACARTLASQGIESSPLHTSHAFHSRMMEPAVEAFVRECSMVGLHPPKTPFVSNVSGTWITPDEAVSPAYWGSQMRKAVRFGDGLGELLREENRVFVEVGPGSTLCSLLAMQPAAKEKHGAVVTLRHPREQVDDHVFFLKSVGRLWGAGVSIDWGALRGDERPKRIPLPTYAFDRQAHWIEPGAQPATGAAPVDRLAKLPDLNDWFSRPVWKPLELPAAQSAPAAVQKNTWLIFDDQRGYGTEIQRRLRASGEIVIMVRNGPAFEATEAREYTIRPAEQGDYVALLRQLAARDDQPNRVIHLLGVDGCDSEAKSDSVDEVVERNFYSLLYLAQAIAGEALSGKVALAVVSDGVRTVEGAGGAGWAKAVNLGPVRVIPRELPEFACVSIDIEPRCPVTPAADWIIAECRGGLAEPLVAYRGTQRLVAGMQRIAASPAGEQGALFKQGGVYLLTGATGGIVPVIARHIAARYRPRLFLLSRKKLPPRHEWDALVSSQSDPEATAIVKGFLELEKLGAEVAYLCADVSDHGAMDEAFAAIETACGVLNGIIHAAGTIDDGPILFKRKDSAQRVLDPKVRGTLVLHERASRLKPDFFVLFSSASTIVTPAGQVDYVAANSFLDSYAAAHFGRGQTKTIAINWGQWREVGMAARMARNLGVATAEPVSGRIVHPLLGTMSVGASGETEFSNTLTSASCWVLDEHRAASGECLLPGTAYLEMALASLGRVDGAAVEITDTFFVKPMVLRGGESREVRLVLKADGEAYDFSISSRLPPAGWEVHAEGRVSRSRRLSERQDPALLAARCGAVQEVVDATITHKHLSFGPRWKSLKGLSYGKGEAVAIVELPEEFLADLEEYRIHPALLDIATGCAQSLSGFDLGASLYVPFSYSRVVVYRNLPPRILSHVRYRPADPSNAGTMTFDITLYDTDGTICADITEFVMKKAAGVEEKSVAVALRRGHTDGEAHRQTTPKATGNTILHLGQREGILPLEGVAAFDRVCANPVYPQYIIVSQNLDALDASLASATTPAAAETAVADGGGASRPHLSAPFAPAQTEVEKGIAEIWRDVLGVAEVGIHDDFMELGGHSLLLTRVVVRMRKRFNVEPALSALFETPTIAAFAKEVERLRAGPSAAPLPTITPVAREAYRIKRSV